MGADARVRGARAGAEVKGRDGNAAALQTHHVWPARSPVLHVTQIQAVIQHRMATSVGQTEARLSVSTPLADPQLPTSQSMVGSDRLSYQTDFLLSQASFETEAR